MEKQQNQILEKAQKLFLEKRFSEAVPIFKAYIREHLKQQVNIDGMGNNEDSVGYYEWSIPEWYVQQINASVYAGTPYDYLSLCFLSLKNNQEEINKGIKWYRSLVDLHPDDYRLVFGLANILSNKGFYDQSLDYYKKTIQLKQHWTKPYECVALIYQYKRIEKPKSIEYASKILALNPGNRVAMFVLARNEKDADLKIERLKEVAERHPKFARVTNQIGIVYGGTKKNYNEAIEWYKKCTNIAPLYSSCYNNIGVNYELKKEYTEAMHWYFQGILRDREYKAAHTNVSDVFDKLQFTDEQIQTEVQKHHVQHHDYFYYYLGIAYYGKDKYDKSITYYNKSIELASDLKKEIHKLYNSIGITYDEMEDYDNALKYYQMCIDNNPDYFSAYYNVAIVYKTTNRTPEAIEWYKKAIAVNPRYSYAYNNLGNIYKNQHNYQEAIKCYKKAVQNLSTYTLALANMGICYLKIKNYRQAFYAMARAKEILPTDNNNLSESNKAFLKETLEQFDKEGEIWRQNGIVTEELRNHVQNYESKFKNLYINQQKEPVLVQKIMKKEVLQVVQLTHKDQFGLGSIERIYKLVQTLYQDNEDYFHIFPQLFVKYFQKKTFEQKQSFENAEQFLHQTIQNLLVKSAFASQIKCDEFMQERKISTSSIQSLSKSIEQQINIFGEKTYFIDYDQLEKTLMEKHQKAKSRYTQFKNYVDTIRKKSNGLPFGVCVKLPTDQKDLFSAIIRIFTKVFQQQLSRERIKKISTKIYNFIGLGQPQKSLTVQNVINGIKKVWVSEITDILLKRKAEKVETKGDIGDLVRGKILFESIDHIKRALSVADELNKSKGYRILRVENRLTTNFQDVVVNVEVKESVCQLKLGLKQNETENNFIKLIQQIEQSPLGCVFGSCLLMEKEVEYSLIKNCNDIITTLTDRNQDESAELLEATIFVLAELNKNTLIFK